MEMETETETMEVNLKLQQELVEEAGTLTEVRTSDSSSACRPPVTSATPQLPLMLTNSIYILDGHSGGLNVK
ncbi:hypothetical protein ACLKA6_012238 [Drosophila palustris]